MSADVQTASAAEQWPGGVNERGNVESSGTRLISENKALK
jgi:hypothetical protein